MIPPVAAGEGDNGCLDRYLVVLSGAGLGGLARYLVASAITARWPGRFPLATFIVNVTGCFAVGVVIVILNQRLTTLHPNWRLFLTVGVLGGYTTFSAFEWEAYAAARAGDRATALAYVLSSVISGYIAVWLGAWLVGRK